MIFGGLHIYFQVRTVQIEPGSYVYITRRIMGILVNHLHGFDGFQFRMEIWRCYLISLKFASRIDDIFWITIRTVLMVYTGAWRCTEKVQVIMGIF